MTNKQTYYLINDSLYLIDGIEDSARAACRFREAWARSADPTSDFPFRRTDIEVAFARENPAVKFRGAAPTSDQGLAALIPEETEARIYGLWTQDPFVGEAPHYSEPMMHVIKKCEGEDRLRYVDGGSLREFVEKSLDAYDDDQGVLYLIAIDLHDRELIHGRHIEHALNLIKGRDNPKVGTLMEFTEDHVRQLERALEDHLQRTATPGYHP
jgi:hypothetical protein